MKAKVQEFDQSRSVSLHTSSHRLEYSLTWCYRNNGQGSSQTGTQPSWGAPSGEPPSGIDRHSQQAYYAPNNAPHESGRRSGSNEVNTFSNIPPSTQSEPNYYGTNFIANNSLRYCRLAPYRCSTYSCTQRYRVQSRRYR